MQMEAIMKMTVLYMFIITFLTGCSSIYPPWRSPEEYPIDYRNASDKKVTIVTMTDERRSVIIVPGALAGQNSDLRVCPEPPADAADNISSFFKTRLAGGNGKLSGEVGFSDGTATALSAIFPRSQGIELFRDGTQTLCLAWLNDVYNNGDVNAWREDFRQLMQLSYQLILQEIIHSKTFANEETQIKTVSAPSETNESDSSAPETSQPQQGVDTKSTN